jgi:2-polyprenyl-6-methoxyphenol hydroxylase-like FAD-dependent oxidoreductase
VKPVLSAGYYAYWEGLQLNRAELYERHRRSIGIWPTNDGLAVTYIVLPIADFRDFRADVDGNIFKTFDLVDQLGERFRAVRRVGRFSGSANLPNRFRRPHGCGWALVGDAGLVMDPITGQGIGHAFRDAELLADAIEAGLGGGRKIEQTMDAYEKERNRQSLPMYRLTIEQAAMRRRRPEADVLYELLSDNQAEIDNYFGLLTGAVSVKEYMSPMHLVPLLGARGVARVLKAKLAGEIQALLSRAFHHPAEP